MATGWSQRADSGGIGWRGFIRLDDGSKRSRTFALKRDADEWWQEQIRSIRRGEFVDPRSGRETFGMWHATFASNELTLRESTRTRDEGLARNHILPRWESVPLERITQHEVQTWITKLSKSDLAPSTVQKVYHVFTKSMKGAVLAGLILRTPCREVKLPTIVAEEMRFLTPDELARLAGTITPWYSTLVIVAGYSGLRFGELVGLRRHRVNLEHRWIDVREITTEVRGKLIEGPPKTRAGSRRVPLPAAVAELLERQFEERDTRARDLVFQGRQGGTLRARAWRSRHFVPAVHAAELAPLRPHDLRHTAVAIWIAAGVDPKAIAKRAGHTSVSTVLDRYGHLFPDSESRFGEAVGELYVPPTAPSTDDVELRAPRGRRAPTRESVRGGSARSR